MASYEERAAESIRHAGTLMTPSGIHNALMVAIVWALLAIAAAIASHPGDR